MITLLQLKYFHKLASTEHITRTAKELYISQTALSSMIIGLEKELGTQLFERSNRAIYLNEAGKLYLKYVDEVFQALDNGSMALKDMAESQERKISIAMGTSQIWLPMIQAFHKEFPQYNIRQCNMSVQELNVSLNDLSIDFVIAGVDDITVGEFTHEWIKTDDIYLCVPQNHRFAKRECVYMDELREEPFINLQVGSPWRRYCDRLFEKAGYKVHSVLECDYTMRASLIEAEFGVALTTSSAREVGLLNPNLYIRVADEYTRRELALFWNPRKYISKAMMDFKGYCTNYWKSGVASEPCSR